MYQIVDSNRLSALYVGMDTKCMFNYNELLLREIFVIIKLNDRRQHIIIDGAKFQLCSLGSASSFMFKTVFIKSYMRVCCIYFFVYRPRMSTLKSFARDVYRNDVSPWKCPIKF
jgi:hypothetical protein